jgi:hypothetical protein
MYTLLQERNRIKDLTQQVFLLGIAGLTTEKLVEILIKEKNIFPESFALESIIFLTIWLGLDLFLCSIFKSRSFLKSFTNRVVAGRCLTTLAIAWGFAAIFFKFYSFVLEFSAMLGLWFLLDFLGSKANKRN